MEQDSEAPLHLAGRALKRKRGVLQKNPFCVAPGQFLEERKARKTGLTVCGQT